MCAIALTLILKSVHQSSQLTRHSRLSCILYKKEKHTAAAVHTKHKTSLFLLPKHTTKTQPTAKKYNAPPPASSTYIFSDLILNLTFCCACPSFLASLHFTEGQRGANNVGVSPNIRQESTHIMTSETYPSQACKPYFPFQLSHPTVHTATYNVTRQYQTRACACIKPCTIPSFPQPSLYPYT